jgi:beta-glucosidase
MGSRVSRIDQLIAAMTLPEKLGQMTMISAGYAVTGPVVAEDARDGIKAGLIGNLLNLYGADRVREMQKLAANSRLGIPLLIGLDVIHGHRTLFPIPLAEAGLFDAASWEDSARAAASEASADGLALTFAPMLDVSRDPRWGRTAEGPGEDPWLASRIAEAKVRGLQGDRLDQGEAIAGCAKHYCAYGAVTAGRDYASVDVSERAVHEIHLPAFAAAVASGVATVMPAFTDLAGVPMTAHMPLLRDWLRGRLGFEGVIISDYNAIAELIRHGVAEDNSQAATLALKAGVDIDMMANAYRDGLPQALSRGWVTLDEIDAAVRRVLTLKERLGLFDDPYRRGASPEAESRHSARRAMARSIAARSIVLLKNDASALPLRPHPSRVALIGPLADAAAEMRGPWWAAGGERDPVSVLAGLRAALPQTEIAYAPGAEIEGGDESGFDEALARSEHADVVVLCLGERATMSGEAASRAQLGLPGRQRELAQAVIERARSRDQRTIALLFSGRPLVAPWLFEAADAVLAAWFPGSEAGHAIADVLTGRASPSGRSAISWPRAEGQIPVFYAERPGGRPENPADPFTSRYLDEPNSPQFPFGHGLTYGRFEYSDLAVTPRHVRESDTLEAQVELKNDGVSEAEETVFLFAHDRVASVTRPRLELKGFSKIRLRPGEQGTVKIQIPANELRFLGADLTPVFEPGEVEILVGPCADRSRLLIASVILVG